MTHPPKRKAKKASKRKRLFITLFIAAVVFIAVFTLVYDYVERRWAEKLYNMIIVEEKNEEGIRQASIAAKIYPQEPYFRELIANAYLNQGDLDKAYQICQEILRTPRNKRAYVLLAEIYRRQQKYGFAITAIKRYLKEPEGPAFEAAALSNLHVIYLEKGDYDEAIATAKKAIALEDRGDHYTTYGAALFQKEQWEEGVRVLEEGLTKEFKVPANKERIYDYLRYYRDEVKGDL